MLTTEQRAFMQKLQDACSVAIKQAHRARNRINGAINWDDLHCCEVKYIQTNLQDEEDEGWFAVVIEEAAPDNGEFQVFIEGKLIKAGFCGVEVITEW